MPKACWPLAVLNTQCPGVGGGQANNREPWPGSCFPRWGGGTTLPPLKCPQAQSRLLHTLPQPPVPQAKQAPRTCWARKQARKHTTLRTSWSHHQHAASRRSHPHQQNTAQTHVSRRLPKHSGPFSNTLEGFSIKKKKKRFNDLTTSQFKKTSISKTQ